MIIKITPEVKADIEKGVKEIEEMIAYEMSISFDLRDYEAIAKHYQYINKMAEAVKRGYLA